MEYKGRQRVWGKWISLVLKSTGGHFSGGNPVNPAKSGLFRNFERQTFFAPLTFVAAKNSARLAERSQNRPKSRPVDILPETQSYMCGFSISLPFTPDLGIAVQGGVTPSHPPTRRFLATLERDLETTEAV